MKLLHLRLNDAVVEFGPGLNLVYSPHADLLRQALMLVDSEESVQAEAEWPEDLGALDMAFDQQEGGPEIEVEVSDAETIARLDAEVRKLTAEATMGLAAAQKERQEILRLLQAAEKSATEAEFVMNRAGHNVQRCDLLVHGVGAQAAKAELEQAELAVQERSRLEAELLASADPKERELHQFELGKREGVIERRESAAAQLAQALEALGETSLENLELDLSRLDDEEPLKDVQRKRALSARARDEFQWKAAEFKLQRATLEGRLFQCEARLGDLAEADFTHASQEHQRAIEDLAQLDRLRQAERQQRMVVLDEGLLQNERLRSLLLEKAKTVQMVIFPSQPVEVAPREGVVTILQIH